MNDDHVKKLGEGANRWNQWRSQNKNITPDLSSATLSLMDFSGADLSRADLSRADLSWANIANANLRYAILKHADMLKANLSGADLFYANLSNANLSGAILSEASLVSATLFGANLTYARIDGTDFENAKTRATIFAEVDFSRAINLEKVRHYGPSILGIDALGKIPEKFLKECDVRDEIIAINRKLVGPSNNPCICFISYSHEDNPFAEKLRNELQKSGITCWMDKYQLQAGKKIPDEIFESINTSDKVLLCASESSLTSRSVKNEIEIAFDKEDRLSKERSEKVSILIALDLDGYFYKWHDSRAVEIRSRLAVDFAGWESNEKKFNDSFEKLMKALAANG